MAWDRTNLPASSGYAVSIVALIIASVLRWQLTGILGFRGNFVTFYPAVTIAALYGGLRLGVPVTIAAALLADLFWIEPEGLLGMPSGNDLLDLILFVIGGILISYLVDMVNRGKARAYNAEQQLQFAAEREKTEKERKRLIQMRLDLIEYAVTHTMDELLSKALDEIGEIVESPIGFYQFVERDQKTLSLQQWSTQTLSTFCKARYKGRHYSIDQAGVWADCIREGRAVIHNDYDSLENRKGMPEGHAKVFRELVVPVMREGRFVAVVGVGNKPVDYTEKDAETVSYLSDVTWEIIERKRDEERIRQKEITLRTVLDQLPSGVTVRDAPTGALILANVKGREIAGTLVEDFAKFPGHRFFHPDNRQYRVEEWPFFRSMTTGKIVEAEEFEYERADGARLAISMNCAPIRDSQGQIIMGACVFNDITERRRAQQRLRESEALLAESQKIGHLGSWSFDVRADRFTCSEEVYRILGLEPQEFEGTYEALLGLVHPEDREAVDMAYSDSLEEKQPPFDKEYRIIRKHTGEVRHIHVKSAHQRDVDGTVLRSVGMVLDITDRKIVEDALREREELLDLFIRHAPASLAMLDRELRFLGFSQRWLSDHNLGDRDLVGLSLYDVLPDVPERWREVNRLALAGEVLKADSDVLERADGSIQWVRWEVRPWRDARGDIAGILIFSEDITERKRGEELLRRYEMLAENSRDIIFFVDFESGRILEANAAAVKAYGYSREKLLELSVGGLRAPSENVFVREQMEKAFSEGILLETIHIRRDGTTFPVEISSRGDTFDNQRTLISVVRDITDRKAAEEKLQRNEEILRTALENLPSGVSVRDARTGALIIENAKVRELLGTLAPDAEHFSGYRFFNIDGRRQSIGELAFFRCAASGEEISGEEVEYEKPGEGRIRLSISVAPIRDSRGQIVMCATSFHDITQLRDIQDALRQSRDELEIRVKERTAELESANEKLCHVPQMLIHAQEAERERLASELHDSIGQTIAALKFRIELVINALEKGEHKQALDLLHVFVPVLQHSIAETRSIYMGLKPMILAEYGILATLEWYRRELLNLYPNQHIELETSIGEGDIPEDLKIVIFRITQEALNNSLKHGKPEWVEARLALHDGAIELEISDDGIGMDLDYIMESCTARSLGLIGMRERAKLTGGEFSIRSAPHEGTTVKAVWRNFKEPNR
ncbi:MAG: PAS domain S-box protein [Syntrophobacteraceae bacterium]